MARYIELWRHTDSDGDELTPEGVRAAFDIGRALEGPYDILISSGAQRATQTLACFLAGMSSAQRGGVMLDRRFRSEVEDRWRSAYERAGSGDMEAFRKADPELVEKESELFADALRSIFERLPDGGRAIVVGHSPMQEAAVYGLTGEAIDPLSKGAGVVVVTDGDGYRTEPAP